MDHNPRTVVASVPVPGRRFVNRAGGLGGADVIGVSENDAVAGKPCSVITLGNAVVEAAVSMPAGSVVDTDAQGRAVLASGLGLGVTERAAVAGGRVDVRLHGLPGVALQRVVSAGVNPLTGRMSLSVGSSPIVSQKILALVAALGGRNPIRLPLYSPAPTATWGALGAAPTLASPRTYYPFGGGAFYAPTPVQVAYNNNGRDVWTASGSTVLSSYSFMTDTDVFEFDGQAQPSASFNLVVDGLYAFSSSSRSASAGGNNRACCVVNFGSRRMRTITFVADGASNMAGIYLPQWASVLPAKPARMPLIALVGDSIGGQFPDPVVRGGPAAGFFAAAGNADVWQLHYGGSGYEATGAGTWSGKFMDRLALAFQTYGRVPDVLVTSGGINDPGAAQTTADILAYYRWCEANLPGTLHVVHGPFCPNAANAGTSKYVNVRDAIKAALLSSKLTYIFLDTLTGDVLTTWGYSKAGTGPWWTGDGRQLIINGDLSGATSATLAGNFTGTTGAHTALFGDGSTRTVTLTNGSAAMTWTGAITTTVREVPVWRTLDGNTKFQISADGTHPTADGIRYLAERTELEFLNGIGSLINF